MPLKLLEKSDLEKLCKRREGETKLGEGLKCGSELQLSDLNEVDARFVVIGVPEDAGPRANHGRAGAESGWQYFLNAFLNLQENQYLKSESILMLGEIDIREMPNYHSTDITKLRALVSKLDQEVSELIEMLVKAGKIPILIGGGHNNAFGLIKGCSKALGKTINCINFDPHTDYRDMEGRHSGNGFKYAREEGYLDQYHVCGLHQNYNSASILKQFREDKGLDFHSFDYSIIQANMSYKNMLKEGLEFVYGKGFGVELDCDGIQHFPSSAITSSGFSPNQARMYAYKSGTCHNALYFHLTEAAPALAGDNATKWGKLMAYLVSDFIKGKTQLFSK
ncbi:MAG: arginase [Flavobacteriales bacterium]|nr:arginase [Flavobacteriales bacterium]|tara:strand:+ start:732 stop:1739 length:1008 start_codon:yes stop_codon:yes gene_type:complete